MSAISPERFQEVSSQNIQANIHEDWSLINRIADVFKARIFPEDYEKSRESCFEATLEACKNKHWSLLVTHRLDICRITDRWQRTLLMHAVMLWEENWVKNLIEHRIAIHVTDLEGNTALHLGAKKGSCHLIPLLIEHLNIEATNHRGETALHIAIYASQHSFAQALLAKGANPNQLIAINNLSLSALALAVMRGEKECVDVLINSQRCSIGQAFPKIGNLLHVAVYFHQPEMLEYLLIKHCAKIKSLIEGPNEKGLTPLSLAAFLGETQAISYLYKANASLECRDFCQRLPIHYAVLGCQHQTIHLLAFLGSKLDKADVHGERPVDLAKQLIAQNPNGPAESCLNFLLNLAKNKEMRKTAPHFTLESPENIVFRGGGPKGLAYGGVLLALEEKGVLTHIRRVAGTSAGAITASLLALGYPTDVLLDLLKNTDFTLFLDYSFSREKLKTALAEKFGGVGKTLTTLFQAMQTYAHPTKLLFEPFKALIKCTGICEGEAFRNWLEALVAKQTGKSHLTFGELRQLINEGKPFKHLHVFGTKIGNQPEIVHMSSEDPQWDNVIISDAVRISMSIPGVFRPHIIHIKQQDKRIPAPQLGAFVDGGLLYNFPIETFDQKKFQTRENMGPEGSCPKFNKRTIGFSLYSSLNQKETNPSNIETVGDLLLGICNAYMGAEELTRQLNPYNASRIIEIDVKDVGTLSFSLSDDKKEELIRSGSIATNAFFQKHASVEQTHSSTRFEKTILQCLELQSPHPRFIGRKKLLCMLQEAFLTPIWKNTNPCHLKILCGPGGIGKTELAVTFANLHLDAFSLIWTIPCETKEGYYAAYRSLATDALKIPLDKETPDEIVAKVHRNLSNTHFDKPWLLFLDNVDRYRPLPDRGGVVLITTQNTNLGYDPKFLIEVPPFSTEESADLFQEIAGPVNMKELELLLKELEYHPQLIAIAAHLIRSTPYSLPEYLERIRSIHPIQEALEDRYPRSLYQTYTLALHQLAQESSLARQWLNLCAYLNPDRISESLIMAWLKDVKRVLHPNEEKKQLIKILKSRFFARYDENSCSLILHRNLQKTLLLQHKHEEKEIDFFVHIAEFLMDQIQIFDIEKKETWHLAEEVFLHIPYLKQNPDWEKINPENRVDLLCAVAWWLGEVKGNALISLDFAEQALEIARTTLHLPSLANSYKTMGMSLSALERHGEALNFRKEALKLCQQMFGKRDLNVAAQLVSIGDSLSSLRDYQGALEYKKEALKLYRDAGDGQHPYIALTLNSIGQTLSILQRPREALSYQNEALQLLKKAFGNQNLHVAISLGSIGATLSTLRQHQEAYEYYKEALDLHKQLFGEQHPEVAMSYNDLATSLSNLGRHPEALVNMSAAIKIGCTLLEANPSSLILYVKNFLHSLRLVNQYEAYPIKSEVLLILKEKLGVTHPLVLEIERVPESACQIL